METAETIIKQKCVTRCTICNKEFTNWKMDVPIIGQPPSETVRKFVGETLAGHILRKHSDRLGPIKQAGEFLQAAFQGLQIMQLFDTEDPNLQAGANATRAGLAAQFRKYPPIPDKVIVDRVARLELDPEKAANVVHLIQEVRDAGWELGDFAAQLPPAV